MVWEEFIKIIQNFPGAAIETGHLLAGISDPDPLRGYNSVTINRQTAFIASPEKGLLDSVIRK